jgi:MraZ protein
VGGNGNPPVRIGDATMLLTGTHPRTLDEKKRLTLPKKVRDQLGLSADQLFFAQGLDQCLWIYDKGGLERLAEKLDQSPASDAEARVFRRLFFAQMENVDIDKAGRVLVPERLLEYAGIKNEVVLIGVRDHLELWDTGRWQQYLGQNSSRFEPPV